MNQIPNRLPIVDDFGTGHSSLSRLFQLSFSELKIDRPFVMEPGINVEARAIAKASIHLAHNLNMSSCAAGVHGQEIRDFLAAEGCDKIQGYLVSRPDNAAAFEKFFHEKNGVTGTEQPNEPLPAVGS